MGYGARKREIVKKGKLIKRVLFGILLFCTIGLCIFGHFYPPESWKYYVSKPRVSSRKAGELRVHFLDVGQGDSTLIEFPDGKVALIDGGAVGGKSKRSVLRTLNALKIKTIDYLIVTHSDADHCGALEEVLKYKKVLNAYLPTAFLVSGSVYADFYADVVKEAECHFPFRGMDLSNASGEYPYAFTFVLPYQYSVDNEEVWESNASAGLWLDYQGASALFAGDAPVSDLENMIEDAQNGYLQRYGVDLSSTEILKVSHHGSLDGTNRNILEYLQPQTAVISCGAGNIYGHPHTEVLHLLYEFGVDTYRTDKQENIMITIRKNGEYAVSTYAK
jgi:competence protein ComEC